MNGTCALAKHTNYPGKEYDSVTHLDWLQDMGEPVDAEKHMKKTLAKDGTWMIVEPFANDRVEDNLNPIGRGYYAASTMICVPASLAYNGPALGAQAGEARLRDVVMKGGLTRFRRSTPTPFNPVLEARPLAGMTVPNRGRVFAPPFHFKSGGAMTISNRLHA